MGKGYARTKTNIYKGCALYPTQWTSQTPFYKMTLENIVMSVTILTFLMPLCMNKFTNFVMDDWKFIKWMPIIEEKFGIFSILTKFEWNVVMDNWYMNEKPHCMW